MVALFRCRRPTLLLDRPVAGGSNPGLPLVAGQIVDAVEFGGIFLCELTNSNKTS